MAFIRRGYVYSMCAISLLVAAIGAVNLMVIGALHAWNWLTGNWLFDDTAAGVRESLSLHLALVLVAIPIFLIHWRPASRWTKEGGDTGDLVSVSRSLYFFVVLTVALAFWVFPLGSAVSVVFQRLLGGEGPATPEEVVRSLVIISVAGAIWLVHAWMRIQETRAVDLDSFAKWLGQLYLYGVILVSVLSMLFSIGGLLFEFGDQILVSGFRALRFEWFDEQLSGVLASILTAGLVWGIHWSYSLSIVRHASPKRIEESRSQIRRTSAFLVILTSAVVVVLGAGIAGAEPIGMLIGVDSEFEHPLVRAIRTCLAVLPFAVAWWYYQSHIDTESRIAGGDAEAQSSTRTHQYLLLLIAVISAAIGLGYLVGAAFEGLALSLQDRSFDVSWRPDELMYYLSFMILGSAIWLPIWFRLRSAVDEDPLLERSRRSRRAYLYLVLAFATLVLLVVVAILLFQVIQILLGVQDIGSIAGDLGLLIGIAIVAFGLLWWQLRTLAADTRHATDADVADIPETAIESVPRAIAALRVSGPGELVLRQVVADLTDRLPEGVTLDHVEIGGASDGTDSRGSKPEATV